MNISAGMQLSTLTLVLLMHIESTWYLKYIFIKSLRVFLFHFFYIFHLFHQSTLYFYSSTSQRQVLSTTWKAGSHRTLLDEDRVFYCWRPSLVSCSPMSQIAMCSSAKMQFSSSTSQWPILCPKDGLKGLQWTALSLPICQAPPLEVLASATATPVTGLFFFLQQTRIHNSPEPVCNVFSRNCSETGLWLITFLMASWLSVDSPL